MKEIDRTSTRAFMSPLSCTAKRMLSGAPERPRNVFSRRQAEALTALGQPLGHQRPFNLWSGDSPQAKL